MTNFTKTLITGLILTMGASASAHAADDTFSVTLKFDNSVSVEENYSKLQKQIRVACKEEAGRGGFRRTDSAYLLQRKCRTEMLAKVIKGTDNPYLTLVHNEATGEKVKTRAYAQK